MIPNPESSLHRKPLYVFKQSSKDAKGPVVVLGPARGGTSMVAGALWHLGYFLGTQACPPVFESNEISTIFLEGTAAEIKGVVEELNHSYERWAWKRPSEFSMLQELFDVIQPIALLYVFRDPLATAVRRTLSQEIPDITSNEAFEENLSNVINDFIHMREAFKQFDIPSGLISYEAALQDPAEFIQLLIDFLKIDCTDVQERSAVTFIQPSPHEYLILTRMSGSKGFLDEADTRVASGWAIGPAGSSPVSVDIYINDELFVTVPTNQPRSDLNELGLGDCAFHIEFDPPLKSGSTIRARVTGDVVDLVNSPRIAF